MMPGCRNFETAIADWLAGSLSLPQSRQVTDHLAQCHACRGEVRQLETTLKALEIPIAEASELAALETLPAKTLTLWKKTEYRRVSRRRTVFAVAAAAAVLALAAVPFRHYVPRRATANLNQAAMTDSELDEPLTIAEPVSATMLDSDLALSELDDAPADSAASEGLGAE